MKSGERKKQISSLLESQRAQRKNTQQLLEEQRGSPVWYQDFKDAEGVPPRRGKHALSRYHKEHRDLCDMQ